MRRLLATDLVILNLGQHTSVTPEVESSLQTTEGLKTITHACLEQPFWEIFQAAARVKGCRKRNYTFLPQLRPIFTLKNYSPNFMLRKTNIQYCSFIPLALLLAVVSRNGAPFLMRLKKPRLPSLPSSCSRGRETKNPINWNFEQFSQLTAKSSSSLLWQHVEMAQKGCLNGKLL
ncbi:hypothetical protein TNCV_3891411 [Trichonephila clavipes]|nr:hypothetical protein TNCV_3891411 [Trichonephila clavipes]